MGKSFIIIPFVTMLLMVGCDHGNGTDKNGGTSSMKTSMLTNEKMQNYNFLDDMYQDEYYPTFLVDKCKVILVDLCFKIEKEKPKNLNELYVLTHAATEEFNSLASEFDENDSEIETVAREAIAADFENIAIAYGFTDADVEELIATREW